MERGPGDRKLGGMYFSIIGSIMTHSHANEIHIHGLHSNQLPPQSPKNVFECCWVFFSRSVGYTSLQWSRQPQV